MTQTIRCPDEIFELFRDPETIAEGRRRTIEWVNQNAIDIEIGTRVILPDPRSGAPVSFTKEHNAVI